MQTIETVLSTARNFVSSRVILTGAELDIFTLLSGPCLSAKELAVNLKITSRGAEILLDALVALELLEKKDNKYSCRKELIPFLSSNSPSSIRPMLLHSNHLWNRWSNLTNIVKNGFNEDPNAVRRTENQMKAFIGAMHAIGSRLAEKVVEKIDIGNAKNLLDIGGASGTYSEAFINANPNLEATIFDLPPVIKLAKERLKNSSVKNKIKFSTGDFYKDEFPCNFDLALLSAIIHQNSEEENFKLYSKIYKSLNAGGRLIIRDHIVNEDHTSPRGGALFAVNMLVATPGGNSYSYKEIQESLVKAGFENIKLLQEDNEKMNGIVEACKLKN